MANLALPVVLATAALLGACAENPPARVDNPGNWSTSSSTSGAVVGRPYIYQATPVAAAGQPLVPATASFKPGSGIIESIALVHILPVGTVPSASAGANAGERLAYRLTVRMDDGSFQAVDQDNRNFFVGDRIALVGDGRVTRQ